MSEGEKLIFTLLMWIARRLMYHVFDYDDSYERSKDYERLDDFCCKARELGWDGPEPWEW